jgi:hypothetical protein
MSTSDPDEPIWHIAVDDGYGLHRRKCSKSRKTEEARKTMKAWSKGNGIDRGVRIGALATLWLVPILIFTSAFSSSWVGTWRSFGVPSMTPKFVDLEVITSGIETLHKGIDPMLTNLADPYHRPMNYPRVWLYLFMATRISHENISIAALCFCSLYLMCISVLIARATHAIDAAIILVAGLSVSPLFSMERGNNDLLVFSLVFLACIVTNKSLKSGLFGTAGLLKLYPVAGMFVEAMRRPGKKRLLAVFITAVVVLLILFQWHDLSLIRRGTPVSMNWSYGVLSLEAEGVHEALQLGVSLLGLGWIFGLGCWVICAATINHFWKSPHKLEDAVTNSQWAEMFSVFGGIFIFTYAIGSNWDYRLIFLLPTLPFALEMARRPGYRGFSISYIVFVFIAENTVGFQAHVGVIAGHVATFTIFILLAAILTSQAKTLRFEKSDLQLADG